MAPDRSAACSPSHRGDRRRARSPDPELQHPADEGRSTGLPREPDHGRGRLDPAQPRRLDRHHVDRACGQLRCAPRRATPATRPTRPACAAGRAGRRARTRRTPAGTAAPGTPGRARRPRPTHRPRRSCHWRPQPPRRRRRARARPPAGARSAPGAIFTLSRRAPAPTAARPAGPARPGRRRRRRAPRNAAPLRRVAPRWSDRLTPTARSPASSTRIAQRPDRGHRSCDQQATPPPSAAGANSVTSTRQARSVDPVT